MKDIVNVWIGTTLKSTEEFCHCFALDYSVDLGEPSYRVCEFCKSLGIEWYDEDFIGVVLKSKIYPIEQIVREILDNPVSIENALQACKEKHITLANAGFWYCVDTPEELEIDKDLVINDCFYIGEFDF